MRSYGREYSQPAVRSYVVPVTLLPDKAGYKLERPSVTVSECDASTHLVAFQFFGDTSVEGMSATRGQQAAVVQR